MTIEKLMLVCANMNLKTKFNVYHNGIMMWSNEYYGLPENVRDNHEVKMFNINVEDNSCDIILV